MKKDGVIESIDREKSFEVTFDEIHNRFVISFDTIVYAVSFFEHGSELQELLECRTFISSLTGDKQVKSSCDTVVIDLSRTRWFDTLSLCYMIMFLYDARKRYKEAQIIKFIHPRDSKFLSFIIDNGFGKHMEVLDSDYNIFDMDVVYDKLYSDVHKCFMQFDIIYSRTEIQDKLSDFRLRVENAFSNSMKAERLEYLINKITYFLHETMENVFDHAYEAETGGCGLLIKTVNCNSGVDFKQYNKKYIRKTPYIKINMYEDSDAYLEVYVIDTGCGIKKSFGADTKTTDNNILDYIFEEGKRSHKKIKREATRYGGLHDIKELLDHDADGLGIKADSVWKYVYNKGSEDERINTRTRYGRYDNLIHGFALVAAIHLPKKQTDLHSQDLDFTKVADGISRDLFSNDTKGTELLATAHIVDERWERIQEKEWHARKNKNTTVIYPPAMSTKKWIVDKVYSNHRKNLVFMEIPDVELKKYRTNISGIKTNRVNAERIIIVTKSLNTTLFERGKDGYFESLKDKQTQFIKTMYSYGIEIAHSLSSLLVFDKLYNSWCFWNMAINLVGSFSYVSEMVKWNEEINLAGYLDFSQMNRLPECRNICIQRLTQLRVLNGESYFNSVDRFTDEICERANFVMEGNRDANRINIGSVFVSGSSNRLIEGIADSYYFLCHPDSKDEQIKTLLCWVNKKFLPQITESDTSLSEFKRLGNSSFIARGGSEYWLKKHFRQQNSFCNLDNKALYSLLQRRVGIHPDTLRIGHFENTERHDIIGYRINYWFESDTVDRQLKPNYLSDSVYDYLVVNFINALKGEIGKESFYNQLNNDMSGGKKDALWAKYRDSDKHSKLNQDGILVYFTDFQTSLIVEKIERLFSKETIKNIVPLIPLSSNYEMGSLIISPLVLDRIEQLIRENQNNDVAVTIFVSVAFNVRLVEEIKQIMHGVGAKDVRVLTILDRRRMPFSCSNSHFSALGRIDFPALHGSGRCSMCMSLEKIQDCKMHILNQDLLSRIDEVQAIWQCIRLSDNEYQRGIESRYIILSEEAVSIIGLYCGDYWGETILIELDSALCSLVMEYTVVSASTQFLMDLLKTQKLVDNDEDGSITVELKIMLASIYLLLFASNPVSNKQVGAVISELRLLLDTQKHISPYTGLALVAISSIPDEYLRFLCDIFNSLEDSDEYVKGVAVNVDALLVRIIAFLTVQKTNSHSIGFLLERRIRCYLTGYQSKVECLYDIFMYSEKSYKNSHRHAFARIIDESAAGLMDYQNALGYAKKILHIIEEDVVYLSLFHDKSILINNRTKIIFEIKEAITELERILKLQDSEREACKLKESVRDSVSAFIQSLININTKWLYLQVATSLESQEYRAIEEWLNYCKGIAYNRARCDRDVKFYFDIQCTVSNYDSMKWFYSFSDVTEEVINLMVDILQYQDGKISPKKESEDYYDGIVKVVYQKKFIEIAFYNSADGRKKIEEIQDIKKSKCNRDSMLVFREFAKRLNESGGPDINSFDYNYVEWENDNICRNNNKVFRSVVRIPYVNGGSLVKPDVFEKERRL